MFRTVTLFTLLALSTPALGQTVAALGIATPTLRHDVTVTGDIVRIGDLVGNAGAAASIPIFRAPDLGDTGSVPVQRVIDALRPHAVIGLNTAGLSEILVTRASRAIQPKDIEARILQSLVGQGGLHDARNVSLNLDRDLRTFHLDASATGELQVTRTTFDPRSGRFDVSIELPGVRKAPMRLTGTAVETAESVTLLRPLARGEILRSSDVIVEKRPKSTVASDVVADLRQAIGLAARQPLRNGQMLRQADLMKPELVQRNDTVVIVYEVPGIMLTIRGKAIDAGGEGDTINVVNLQSKRTIQGVVSGPGRVTVSAPRVASISASSDPVNSTRARAE
jgi:flagella basal body P-ring formation protein FlgA